MDVYDELVKNVNTIETIDTNDLVKNLTTTQKLIKLKRKILIKIILSILLLKNLMNLQQKILLQG